MKVEELRNKFNEEFGLNPHPKTYEVDAETYGYCCQAIFNWLHKYTNPIEIGDVIIHDISLGKHNGLMFKGVELILKETK